VLQLCGDLLCNSAIKVFRQFVHSCRKLVGVFAAVVLLHLCEPRVSRETLDHDTTRNQTVLRRREHITPTPGCQTKLSIKPAIGNVPRDGGVSTPAGGLQTETSPSVDQSCMLIPRSNTLSIRQNDDGDCGGRHN